MTYIVKKQGDYYGPFSNGQSAGLFAGPDPAAEIIQLKSPDSTQAAPMPYGYYFAR